MRRRYAILLTAVASVAATLATPSLERKATSSTGFRLIRSAAAGRAPAQDPAFMAPPRVMGKNLGVRVYLIHGLPGYLNYWDAPSRQPLLDALLLNGAQVVVLKLPDAQQAYFGDGGATYCRAFDAWFDNMTQAIEKQYGEARQYTVGVSYGGLHAMLAAEHPQIAGWVAISPVTDISRLAEFRFQSNDKCRADPRVVGSKPGLMIFGRSDQRVGTDLMEAEARRIREAGATDFVSREVDAAGHDTTPEIIGATAAWIGAKT